MAIIHKVIEGGEQYLGWALARERALRSQGGNRTIKYDLGDAEVEIRVVGNQSFVTLRETGVQVSREWVAFPLFVELEFSASNAVDTYDGPEGTKRPEPPQMPPLVPQEEPKFDASPFEYPKGQISPGSDEYPAEGGPSIMESEMDSAFEQRRVYVKSLLEQIPQADRGVASAVTPSDGYSLSVGITFHAVLKHYPATYVDGILMVPSFDGYFVYQTYEPAKDVTVAKIEWYRDVLTPFILQANLAQAAAYAAYQAQLAQWTATTLAEWEANNLPSNVCPPYFVDLIAKQRAGRDWQIAALRGEIAKGLAVLPMFNPAMHPAYIPKEAPALPFVMGELAAQAVWNPDGGYDTSPSTRVGNNYSPAVKTCGAVAFGTDYTNAYVLRFISHTQAFGYMVNGVVRTQEASTPPLARATPHPNYAAWLNSPRAPAQFSVSFDFFHGTQAGEVYFALFEYEAYDYATDQWVWTPSLGLLSSSPLISCYSLCYSYPDHEREATYTNRPDHFNGVRAMRSTGFYKQVRASDGTWSAMQNLGGQPITVNLQPLTSSGAVYGFGLPDGIVALKGLQGWMLPMLPNPQVAVSQEYLGGVTIPAGPSTISSSDEFMHWLYAQCLTRFQIPFQ